MHLKAKRFLLSGGNKSQKYDVVMHDDGNRVRSYQDLGPI